MVWIVGTFIAERIGAMGTHLEIGELLTAEAFGFELFGHLFDELFAFALLLGQSGSQLLLFFVDDLHGFEFDEPLHRIVRGQTVHAIHQSVLLATYRTVYARHCAITATSTAAA